MRNVREVSQTLFGEAASAVLAVFLIFDCDLQKHRTWREFRNGEQFAALSPRRNVLERMIESLSRRQLMQGRRERSVERPLHDEC